MPQVQQAVAPREIARYFDISLYLLLITGFFTLASTGKLDIFSVIFVTAALIFRGYLLSQDRNLYVPVEWTDRLAIAYFVLFLIDWILISRSFVPATVHLVLFSMVVKIFSVQTLRDQLYLAGLSFMSVLAAAILTVDTIFLAAFCVFLLLAVNTFISMEMKRSAEAATARAIEAPNLTRRMGRSIANTTVVLAVSIVLTAVGFFFILPRVSGGYLSRFAPRNVLETGFSNEVNLGMIGEIQQSTQVVMHIKIEGDVKDATNILWRGTALANFDGKRWFNERYRGSFHTVEGGRFDLTQTPSDLNFHLSRRDPEIRYRVMMEPIANRVFFLAPVPTMFIGNYSELVVDPFGTVYNSDRRGKLITTYEARSRIRQYDVETLRAASGDIPERIVNDFLQLPQLDQRIPALAAQIVGASANDFDRALAIESYLRTNFPYTLELPSEVPPDPLAHFLFERKRGHCEYFASAMAIMLRTQGIPSRVVNGFRGSEYNDITGSYVVRARRAHSWVEAYFPGQGWVTFDPTPGGGALLNVSNDRFSMYMDAMREFWREWIINYDYGHQESLGKEMLNTTREKMSGLRLWFRQKYEALVKMADQTRDQATDAPATWKFYGAGLLTAFLLLINARRLWRAFQHRRVAGRPGKSPKAAATLWYERMQRTVGRRGWTKLPTQTPQEFVFTIEDPHMRARVEAFTKRYERARFGESSEDAEALPELFEEIKRGGR